MLDNPNIITGVKPKQKADPPAIPFDKNKPLGPYNFPTYSYAEYRIHGYRLDAAGIRHPVSWTERLPMGRKVTLEHPDDIIITSCERTIFGPRQY